MVLGKEQKQKTHQTVRRPYRKPQLCAYGTVKGLTAGGTGITVEASAGGSGKCIPNPKQQRC